MFIHREDMYVTPEEWEVRNPERPYPQNLAELIVAKHRHGPVGSVFLHFNARLARFENPPVVLSPPANGAAPWPPPFSSPLVAAKSGVSNSALGSKNH